VRDAASNIRPALSHGIREDDTIAPPKEEWFERVLELVPADPPGRVTREYFDELVLSSLEEMRADYYYSVKVWRCRLKPAETHLESAFVA
jgi:hypothetical protein